jgi:hypothetical protein
MVNQWWMFGCLAAAAAVVVLGLLAFRRWREEKAERAIDLLEKVGGWEIVPLNRFLKAAGTRNVIGKNSMVRIIRELAEDIRSGGFDKMLIRIAWKVIDGHILKVPELRQKLVDKIAGKPEVTLETPPPTLTK